jgi:hypothetical protein
MILHERQTQRILIKLTTRKTLYEAPTIPTNTQHVLPDCHWLIIITVVKLSGIVVVQDGIRFVMVTSADSHFTITASIAHWLRW